MRYKSKHTRKTKTHYSVLIFRVAALLAVLTLITSYLLSGAYSKFYTSASGGDSARVARFSPAFTSNSHEIIVSDELPGYSAEIPFEVKNTSDDKVSEVAMKYKIVVKTTGNIPLTFTLYDKDEHQLNSDSWDCNGISGEQIYEYENISLVFGVGTIKTEKYKLKIEWPSDRKNAQFSGMTDAVYLGVEFLQID